MSLEDSINKLTAAVEANTKALQAGGGKSSGGSSGSTSTNSASAGGKHTKDEMIAAINKVNEVCGTPAAKEIIAASGAKKMAEITDPAKIDAAYEAAQKALKAKEEDGGGL